MALRDLDLGGNGRFLEEPGAFAVENADLERPWHYLYVNERIVLRVSHAGPLAAQAEPPGGTLLMQAPRHEITPPLQIFAAMSGTCATAFLSPLTRNGLKEYRCVFRPECAEYLLRYDRVAFSTRMGIDRAQAGLWLACRVENTSNQPLPLQLLPVLRFFHAPAAQAPWDMPELYQRCGFFNDGGAGVFIESFDPGGRPGARSGSFLVTDLPIAEAETSARRFLGAGGMLWPDSLFKPLRPAADREYGYDRLPEERVSTGIPCVAAMRSRELLLEPGGKTDFSLGLVHRGAWNPERASECRRAARALLTPERQEECAESPRRAFAGWRGRIAYDLPDKSLQAYMESFVPLQLQWVGQLDRGWPTGMRGTRDAAQDHAGVLLADPGKARAMLLEIFACQKADGGFLRQFSVRGPGGPHDARDYVDSGCWVFELLYDYLRHTGDMALLDAPCRSLDDPAPISIQAHAEKTLAYYLADWNRGPHGLVLIREGDWNDSMNTAGLELRGESVMVSCQVVFLLNCAAEMFPGRAARYRSEAERLRAALRAHALAPEGFLRGVFNDDGHWLFSERDPDGRRRVNAAVNAWGVIADVFEPDEQDALFGLLKELKAPYGYRLFHPPLGRPPVARAGRLGTGDQAAGLCENGTVYNHGSQGFLLRAAAHARRAELIADILGFLLPYDQERHPTAIARSEPYGIVNYYYGTADSAGEGGVPFLSGTVSTVYRAFLEGVLGLQLRLDGLRVSPCLPEGWSGAAVSTAVRGRKLRLTVARDSRQEIALNGRRMPGRIEYAQLMDDGENLIECRG